MKFFRLVIGAKAVLLASLTFAAANSSNHLVNSSAETQPPFSVTTAMAEPKSQQSRLTTLDVLGIGLSVEMFRQGKVWDEMRKHPTVSILPTDLSKYPTIATAMELASEKRAADTLEYGASNFVEHWPIPSISVWPYCNSPVEPGFLPGTTNYAFFNDRIDDLRMPAGMHTHKIHSLGAFFSNEPEEVLERAFQFFDGNPEVPALIIMVEDGDLARAGVSTNGPYVKDGPRKPDAMTETFVVFVLARRDRVTALRPFTWHSHADSGAEFMEQRDTYLKTAKPGFKPSKYLPFPWSDEQIAEFDKLPTIAVLHRPIRVTYRHDKDGKPTFDTAKKESLVSAPNQQAEFKKAFDAALQEIPGGKPARIFYDTAGPATGNHVIPLSLAAHNSLPDFDLFKPDLGYDISARMGNTGAASPFVQWALAAMSSFQNKDSGVTVNLRQSEEATITVVTPSADTQASPMGHPYNFNLAPQDGSSAVPVKPATPAQPPSSSVSAPMPPVAAAPVRHAELGVRLATGDICSQTGLWQCDPPDAMAGDKHVITAGRKLPPVRKLRDLTAFEKLRGVSNYDTVPATYTLLSYDLPNA